MAYWKAGKSWRGILLPFSDLFCGCGTQLETLDMAAHVDIQVVAGRGGIFGGLPRWSQECGGRKYMSLARFALCKLSDRKE